MVPLNINQDAAEQTWNHKNATCCVTSIAVSISAVKESSASGLCIAVMLSDEHQANIGIPRFWWIVTDQQHVAPASRFLFVYLAEGSGVIFAEAIAIAILPLNTAFDLFQ